MKSKEEIFDKYSHVSTNELGDLNGPDFIDSDDFYKAADEYSEQIAIGFAEWIANNKIQRNEVLKGVWYWDVPRKSNSGELAAFPEYDNYTTYELHNLYRQTLK